MRRASHLSVIGEPTRPDLVIKQADLTVTARELADLLAQSGHIFFRGAPAKIIFPPGDLPYVRSLSPNDVVVEAHAIARPVQRVKFEEEGEEELFRKIGVTLPNRVAQLYLALGDWNLPPLKGITTTPLLADDGSAQVVEGYHAPSAMWCTNVPELSLPGAPTRTDALAAVASIREAFRTFPFADAVTLRGDVPLVDLSCAPGYDESGFLAGLLTAICRPSLELAPGLIVSAPTISGAGTGKGLLVRAISMIAFGAPPQAFNAGNSVEEMDKRIAAQLMKAPPVLFLDNLNTKTLRSELLASVLTEPRVVCRVLGLSEMLILYQTAFVAVTGNGLSLSEDQTRRFIGSALDAKMEDPERRAFAPGFLDGIKARRHLLLADALTIWRYGRINAQDLVKGRPLGSYETWCGWVRDPLLNLGCADPVERAAFIKARDPIRERNAELFATWWACHSDSPLPVSKLNVRVLAVIDPQNRGRHVQEAQLRALASTRANGFVLTRQASVGKWGAATYALHRTEIESGPRESR